MHRKIGDQLGEAAVLESIGDAHILQAEYQRAATCFYLARLTAVPASSVDASRRATVRRARRHRQRRGGVPSRNVLVTQYGP
jgi:hypothetical protein